MSSLRTKLRRLGAVGPTPREPTASLAASEVDASPPPSGAEQGLSATRDKQELLEQLRDKIARVVARERPRLSPADPTAGELPFHAEDTPCGRLYVRNVVFSCGHRIGKVPTHSARGADSTMLSLLALDPSLAECDPRGALYIDTETTGLSGGTGTLVFLLGLGFFDEAGRLCVEQLLLRRPGEEAPMLARASERIARASMLVSYNGKAFDLPLVRTRLVMNKMPAIPPLPHLDLLHVARRLHRKRLGSCSLGTVESHVLGLGRGDDVPSAEVAARYAHFLRTADESALLGVVEHNACDVTAMVGLVGLYGEPMDGLSAEDLAAAATTLGRAGAADRAQTLANEAVVRGGGVTALRARGWLAKARGDRRLALRDFEKLVTEVEDPSVRLELAKIYEHTLKQPERALEQLACGVAESPEAVSRRRSRLQKKAAKAQASIEQNALPGFRDRTDIRHGPE